MIVDKKTVKQRDNSKLSSGGMVRAINDNLTPSQKHVYHFFADKLPYSSVRPSPYVTTTERVDISPRFQKKFQVTVALFEWKFLEEGFAAKEEEVLTVMIKERNTITES